jgi:hypothetical protein
VEEMIIEHLTKLQNHPQAVNAYKHIVIEANMSYISADEVAMWCRRKEFTNMIIESRDTTDRGRVGIWTGNYEKEAYAYTLREMIKQLNLFFSSHMFGRKVEEIKKQFIAQLRNFRLERLEPNDPGFGKYKYSFTGKTKGGLKDDLVLAAMMDCYWGQLKRENSQFMVWAQQYGIRL